jgi:hypothetical protein
MAEGLGICVTREAYLVKREAYLVKSFDYFDKLSMNSLRINSEVYFVIGGLFPKRHRAPDTGQATGVSYCVCRPPEADKYIICWEGRTKLEFLN